MSDNNCIDSEHVAYNEKYIDHCVECCKEDICVFCEKHLKRVFPGRKTLYLQCRKLKLKNEQLKQRLVEAEKGIDWVIENNDRTYIFQYREKYPRKDID